MSASVQFGGGYSVAKWSECVRRCYSFVHDRACCGEAPSGLSPLERSVRTTMDADASGKKHHVIPRDNQR